MERMVRVPRGILCASWTVWLGDRLSVARLEGPPASFGPARHPYISKSIRIGKNEMQPMAGYAPHVDRVVAHVEVQGSHPQFGMCARRHRKDETSCGIGGS